MRVGFPLASPISPLESQGIATSWLLGGSFRVILKVSFRRVFEYVSAYRQLRFPLWRWSPPFS
ncbi:hypothetical protein ErPhphiEa104_gp043 [Erwinia phage phiEa104]|uniref:Uncharacterized protein n=4 Tax=Caudoviricetes TaxID=2731619 RepID=E5AFX4_9CAUD|nr:hypothetical protein Ea21-4_gp44 [Erwinia phage phiEa21-4]YP_004327018.1 hypothetical protein ErPhphiEa104_gp043 [Erwinia phage phiEa104]ACH88957.1 hypothetical phage protein [Erwinia phage phiEa21-4]CBX44386.1 hypothetical protein P104_00430 [Erwinia phage phiEa104]